LNTITNTETAVPGMDIVAARRWQSRRFVASPWLHEEVASRMSERLAWIREKPASWMHWEPVLGGVQGHHRVKAWAEQAPCYLMAHRAQEALAAVKAGLGPVRPFWHPARWGGAAAPQMAGSDTVVGMLWANMALHHEPTPQALLRQWSAHVAEGGFLMFSCLGPDTLRELRAVYQHAGWPPPSHAFTDMHDWGDMLVHSGFAEPVMDMERVTLSYSNAASLLDELRGLGRNLSVGRHERVRSRSWLNHMHAAIEKELPRSDDGRLLLTFEIIYGHAFKPQGRPMGGRSQTVSVDEMRAMLRAPRR
jgi:malonyl-CoA O-methyltransferase